MTYSKIVTCCTCNVHYGTTNKRNMEGLVITACACIRGYKVISFVVCCHRLSCAHNVFLVIPIGTCSLHSPAPAAVLARTCMHQHHCTVQATTVDIILVGIPLRMKVLWTTTTKYILVLRWDYRYFHRVDKLH